MHLLKILFITILATSYHIVLAQTISGIASNIDDGDTFKLKKSNGGIINIRLANIDAPELSQTHGKISRDYLKKMIDGKKVVVEVQRVDALGRCIGVVFLNSININDQLIANGHAWHYAMSKNINICKIENMARRNKVGLWADPNPISPWEYREASMKKASKFRESNPFRDYVDRSDEILDSLIKNRKYLK